MSTTFNYKILKDPMRVSDEDFFGIWDSEKQVFKKEGIFDFDKYSKELASVICAVKSGDYKLAKDELLRYYRENRIPDLYKARETHEGIDEETRMRCLALEKNVYSANSMNGKAMDFFTVSEKYTWHTVNVTRSVTRLKFGGIVQVAYQLMAVDKTNISARFYSRKSEYVPYLELTVNSEKIKVNCCKDTMLWAGENSSQNYSQNEVYEVCEDGYYHNHGDNTKRAYFVYDLSFIKATDTVTEATFNVYGGTESGEKEIFLYNEFEASWDETLFCWDKVTDELCFSCSDMNSWDFITSSSTTIKGKICFYHRGSEHTPNAEAFLKTGEEKYAYTFIRNAMAIVHHVGSSREVLNQLDMSRYIDTHTRDLFRVITSKYMTGERFVAIVKNIYAITDWLVKNFYGGRTNNWASFATEGVYCVTAFFREVKMRDGWRELTMRENDRLLSKFKNDDDSCVELGQHYHSVLIRTITGLYNIRKLTGEPLPLSENSYDVVYRLMKSFYYTLSPTGCDYNIADTTEPNSSYVHVIRDWYNLCGDIVGQDEEIKYVVTGGKEGKLPNFTTINYPVNRRTYMKTDWTKDALAMVVTGKRVGSHGHDDVFSLAMMAYGRHLVTDQGYGTQLTGGIREAMVASSTHNVVLADDVENTLIKDAEQLAFDTNDKFDYCEYSGANNEIIEVQNRSVTFSKEGKFWIVTDYIKPKNTEKVTKYTQYWHMLPEAGMSIEKDFTVRSNFADGINVMIVPIGKIDFAEIANSKYSPGAGVIVDSKKAKLIKSQIGAALFTTLIIPINRGEGFKVEAEGYDSENVNSFVAKITAENGSCKKYYFAHSNNETKKISSGKYFTEGVNMLVCEDEDGNVVSRYDL